MSGGHAIVVGGTRGLGRVVVERFLARDLNVTILSRNPPTERSARLRHVKVDLEKVTCIDEIDIPQILATGPINYLALTQRFRGDGDPWAGEIQVGLSASRILIEGFVDHFAASGDRAIAAASSVYAQFVGGSQPVGYHVVKAGLNAMTRYYAWSLGTRGIRVNTVMPLSYVKDESREYYSSNEPLNELYRRFVPLRRMGDVADSANAIDFLCSEKAAFVTGQSLFVDGGVSVVWPEETAKTLAGL